MPSYDLNPTDGSLCAIKTTILAVSRMCNKSEAIRNWCFGYKFTVKRNESFWRTPKACAVIVQDSSVHLSTEDCNPFRQRSWTIACCNYLPKRLNRTCVLFYSGCQKTVSLFERFLLQPLILPIRISAFIFEER